MRQSNELLKAGLALALVCGVAGCHKTAAPAVAANAVDQDTGDPADANLAPANGATQVLGQNDQYQPQQQGTEYAQQPPAPIERQNPGDQSYDSDAAADAYAADLTNEVADDPPPPLPDYDQPPAPDPNYIWTPGYWAWSTGGYYWVPGCWVAAPYIGALWTPGYWGFYGGRYRFHHGFWGRHIGFYGGIDYGFGYTGYGYYGGYWNNGNFFYNTAVNRVNTNAIHDVYNHNVVIGNRTMNGAPVNRVSFNGGQGGVHAQPKPAELAVLHEQRNAPMAAQLQVRQSAERNPAQFFRANKGRPQAAAVAQPVAADHGEPRALPRVATPTGSPAPRGETAARQGRNASEMGRPAMQQHPAQRQAEAPQQNPARPMPQPQAHPEPQARPEQQARPQPQARPEQQARPQPQARPEQQARPQPQARPEQQARPQPQSRPEQHARPQEPPRPQPQARPEQHARPEAPPHEEPHPNDKPKV